MTVIVALISTSCSLQEEPKYSFTSETVFKNESTAEAVIMQNYGWLGSSTVYGQTIHEATIANGMYWSKTDGDRLERTIKFNNFAENPNVNTLWTGFYRVISESNYLIKGLETSSLSANFKTRGVAHARFLRGFAYFKLANLYGKAALITAPITTDNLHTPLSERTKIYEQALSDLVYASENLPLTEKMDGLATKDVAAAFVAKCYWIMGNHSQADGNDATALYTLAKSYGDKVMAKFMLEPKFANLWVVHSNNSPESIFQINFTDAIGNNLRTSFNFGPTGSRISALQPSFGNIKFDRAFYDLHRGTYPDDPRMASTYLSRWTNATNTAQTFFAYPLYNTGTPLAPVVYDLYASAPRGAGNSATNPVYNLTDPTVPNVVKNTWNSKGTGDNQLQPLNSKMLSTTIANAQYDPKNLIIFRYADLLLLMADVENELGNGAIALTYLNKVLDRARTSGAAGTIYPKAQTALPKDAMRDRIFFERMFELAGEPTMFEDVRRRGTTYLRKVLDIHNNSNGIQYRTNYEVANKVGGLFRDHIINNGTLTEDFLKKNLLLPIPADEINRNDNINQVDQNFGY